MRFYQHHALEDNLGHKIGGQGVNSDFQSRRSVPGFYKYKAVADPETSERGGGKKHEI